MWLGNKHTRSFNTILVGATILMVSAGVYYIYHSKSAQMLPEEHFEIAQYYFNHDEDPTPPYDLEKARQHFKLALEKNPQVSHAAWYQLGRIDFLEGRFSSAIQNFLTQIEYYDDTIPSVHYMLGLTYAYKAKETSAKFDWEQAEKNFLTYLDHEPLNPWGRVDLSWVYFAQGKFESMIPLLEPIIDTNADNPWVLNMYGLALLNTERLDVAHEMFKQAKTNAEPLTPEDWGRSYPGNNPAHWAQGLQEFKQAIEKNYQLTLQNKTAQ